MTDEATPPPDSPEAEVLGILNSLGYEGLTEQGKQQRQHAIAKLMTTDWKDLELVEHDDHLLFPDTLIRRSVSGEWQTIPVRLRVPRERDLRRARVEARELAKRERIDEERDRDLFVNLENLCILAYAIRNDTAPYEPFEPEPLVLEKLYDKVCLQHMWEKVERLNEILNPAPSQLSSPEIVALIVAIARARHLGPLVVYGPGAQTSFVVSTVDLLLNLLSSKLSSESLERLMQESLLPSSSPD